MPPKRTIRAFLDDSGHKEYGANTSRHFVYAAVLVDSVDESRVNADLADLKRYYFRTPDVELKSSWLRFPRDKKRRYLDPYGLTEESLTRFIEDLYQWMEAAPITFAAAVVDKPQMKDKYGEKAYYPSAYAYQIFLQRYEMHLSSLCSPSKDHNRSGCSVIGSAMMDLMDGASPAMNQWKSLLQRQHVKLKKNGCSLMKLRFDHVAPYLWFGDSKAYHLIQIADLVAYNVFRQFREHGQAWDEMTGSLPLYSYLARLLPKFMNDKGRWDGYGIVKCPDHRGPRGLRWGSGKR